MVAQARADAERDAWLQAEKELVQAAASEASEEQESYDSQDEESEMGPRIKPLARFKVPCPPPRCGAACLFVNKRCTLFVCQQAVHLVWLLTSTAACPLVLFCRTSVYSAMLHRTHGRVLRAVPCQLGESCRVSVGYTPWRLCEPMPHHPLTPVLALDCRVFRCWPPCASRFTSHPQWQCARQCPWQSRQAGGGGRHRTAALLGHSSWQSMPGIQRRPGI